MLLASLPPFSNNPLAVAIDKPDTYISIVLSTSLIHESVNTMLCQASLATVMAAS